MTMTAIKSTKELVQLLIDFWEKEQGFNKLSSEFNQYSLLTSPYFPHSFNPSVGAGILDHKVKKILGDPNWKANFSSDLYYVKGANFREFDAKSVGHSEDRLSLFHSFACFAINNPANPTITKEEFIKMAHKFLCDVLGISPSNLIISYFSGGRFGDVSFEPDNITFNTWRTLGIKSNNFISSSSRLNFLISIAEQYGDIELLPFVGPRSEIFYLFPHESQPKLIEIATMQFIHGTKNQSNSNIIESPKVLSIAFGVERLLMALNSYNNIFHIDLLNSLISSMYKAINNKTRGVFVKEMTKSEVQTIVDHLRAFFFLKFHLNQCEDKQALSSGRQSILNRLKREIIRNCQTLGINLSVVIEGLMDDIIKAHHSIYSEFQKDLLKIKGEVRESFKENNIA